VNDDPAGESLDEIEDVTGTTRWSVEVDNPLHPESAFMLGSNGVTVEFDRETVFEYVKRVWGLVDPLEIMWASPAARTTFGANALD